MKLFSLFILVILLITGIAACAPVVTGAPEAAPTLEPTQPAEGFYPLTTHTGNERIDAVLAAVASGNVEELRSLIEFTSAECTTQEGLGGPPKCREGEAKGTSIDVLPFMGGEGSFLHKEDIETWQGIDVSGLYAIYEVSPAVSSEQYYPVGKYAILLVSEENKPAVALRIGETGIVRVDHILGSSPESLGAMVEREASTVILAPPAQ